MKKITISILILIPLIIILYCNYNPKTDHSSSKALVLIKKIALKVPEPSGLHFDKKTNTLWTVSDEDRTIYNLELDGSIINKIITTGFDLEGITIVNDSILVTVLERDRVILFLDKEGKELNRIKVDITGDANKGLEGITYNSIANSFYVVNEKKPGLLFEIDSSGKIISRTKLTFASDYSGLFYNKFDNKLWITSDEDKALYKCEIDGKLIEKYSVNIEQIEGVSINVKDSLIYIISDPLEQLFVFELP